MKFLGASDQFQAVHPWHLNVCNQEMHPMILEYAQSLFTVGGLADDLDPVIFPAHQL
jgi:hypothetical protein